MCASQGAEDGLGLPTPSALGRCALPVSASGTKLDVSFLPLRRTQRALRPLRGPRRLRLAEVTQAASHALQYLQRILCTQVAAVPL